MKMSWLRITLAALTFLGSSPLFSDESSAPKVTELGRCSEYFGELDRKAPIAGATVDLLRRFAEKHRLPMKVVEVGPPERRVKRLVVGLNFHDWDLMKEYQRTFNLEAADSPKLGGVLPLEYAFEIDRTGKSYVGTGVRPRPSMESRMFMFGREDVSWMHWWDNSVMHPEVREKQIPIVGFAHLIGTSPEEQKNIWHYLYHPGDRALCKSDNCVAWQSQIEFGKTAPGVPEADREFLASRLGFSRTIEHAEMTRRMFHYANEEHGAIVAWLNGPKGVEAFEKNLEAHLPPLPKKTPREAVKGVTFARNVALENAIAQIPDRPHGTRILFPIGPGASQEAMEALIPHAAKSKHGVDVHVFVNGISERVFQQGIDQAGDKFRVHALFLGGNLRRLQAENRVSIVPGYLSDFARYMRTPGMRQFQYDAAVVRVSPPDEQGRYSLGPNCDHIVTAIEANPGMKIIAEINPNIPFTTGANFLRAHQITASFESKGSLPNPSAVEKTAVEAKIGEYLGALVPSGATVQVGIGNVFGGLGDGLAKAGAKNIRISTEMMGDDVMSLIDRGIATDAETTFGFGSGDFYKALHKNPKVVFRPTEVINDPSRIAKVPGFHAINTAIQVSLHGEVNATMGPPERGRISSPGGQVEFMTGASRSPGGKAIIALRSTAKSGTLSTIVLDLYPGPITTPHETVTHVVTEYGVAELAGRSEAERALALINVAHPKFREGLFNEAVKRRMLTERHRAGLKAFEPDLEAHAAVADAQRALVAAAKRNEIPAFLRKVHDGKQLPVLLLNKETYPKLRPFLESSLATGVKLFPFDNRGTDHGVIRVGDSLVDYYWPGSDRYGQLHQTGVFWLHVPDYLGRRDASSQRIIEVAYALTPEERAVAEYYHRVRRAGSFVSRYEFSAWDGIYHDRPQVLSRGFENCYAYGVNERSFDHVEDMKQQLTEMGATDVEALLASPEARKFLDAAKTRALGVKRIEGGKPLPPEKEAALLDVRLFARPGDAESLGRWMPAGLDAAGRTRFLNFLVGIDATRQYQRLGAELGLNGNFWNFGSPRATAILVWDSEQAADSFREARYEEGGGNPAYQLRDSSRNVRLNE